jgi:hypothetical protein
MIDRVFIVLQLTSVHNDSIQLFFSPFPCRGTPKHKVKKSGKLAATFPLTCTSVFETTKSKFVECAKTRATPATPKVP